MNPLLKRALRFLTVFPLRKFYTEQMFVLVRIQFLHSHVAKGR